MFCEHLTRKHELTRHFKFYRNNVTPPVKKYMIAYPICLIAGLFVLPVIKLPFLYPGPAILPAFSTAENDDVKIIDHETLSGRRVKLDYEVREGSILLPNHLMNRSVNIPHNSKMSFSIGVQSCPGVSPFRLIVLAKDPKRGKPVKVLGAFIDRSTTRWEEYEVDMSSYSGTTEIFIQIASTEAKPGTGLSETQADPDLEMVYVSKILFHTKQEKRKPNFVIVTVDTLRTDHLTTYGYDIRNTDPFLKNLWQTKGVRFNNATSSSSWTIPAVASILTSLYAKEHGVNSNDHLVLREELLTLPEILSENNYRTAAFSGNFLASPSFNFFQGFERFDDAGRFMFDHRGDEKLARRIEGWLTDYKKEPFFIYVHLINPHYPYIKKPAFETKSAKFEESIISVNNIFASQQTSFNLLFFPQSPLSRQQLTNNKLLRNYDDEILRTDKALEIIFEITQANNNDRETFYFIVADHGDEFNDHGSFYHKTTLYQELIHVPFIVSGPFIKNPGDQISCPVSLVDIMPTVLDYASVDQPENLSGISLRPLLSNGLCDEKRPIFSVLDNTTEGFPFQEAVIVNNRKLIRYYDSKNYTYELYDLEIDPFETNNILITSQKWLII